MTLTDTAIQDVRAHLVAGVGASNRRRSRRRMAAAVPIVALAATAGLLISDSDNSPAFALTPRGDGSIRVEIYPEFEDVSGLRSALAEAGLQTSIVHLRAHPSLDGVVEVVSHANEATRAVEFQDGDFVIDVAKADAEIEILIYSDAGEGNYQATPSAFAIDQPLMGLHCAFLDAPLTTGELEQRALAVGVSKISWTIFGKVDAASGAVDTEDFEERPEGIVTGAQMRNRDELWVSVSTDPDLSRRPAAGLIEMRDGTHYRDVQACSPDLADQWR